MQLILSTFRLLPLLLISHIYCAGITQTTASENESTKITTIVFDLGGVLFQQSKTAFAQKVGLGKLTKYTLFNWSNPETTCLNALHTISLQESRQPSVPLLLRDKKMPCCIIDWQLGHTSHAHALNELKQQIEMLAQKNHFKNSQEKELVLRMLDVGIDPQHLNDIVKPATAMIELVKELKSRKYKIIILSNLAQEQYDLFHKTYPEITQLFDDIIVSSHVNIIKPNQEIYQHLLDTHKLTAQECVYIDNQDDNIEAAQQKGMRSISHKNLRATRASLEKLGV
jgi:HAD superfamily hydrolase (TIGR01509 family)